MWFLCNPEGHHFCPFPSLRIFKIAYAILHKIWFLCNASFLPFPLPKDLQNSLCNPTQDMVPSQSRRASFLPFPFSKDLQNNPTQDIVPDFCPFLSLRIFKIAYATLHKIWFLRNPEGHHFCPFPSLRIFKITYATLWFLCNPEGHHFCPFLSLSILKIAYATLHKIRMVPL